MCDRDCFPRFSPLSLFVVTLARSLSPIACVCFFAIPGNRGTSKSAHRCARMSEGKGSAFSFFLFRISSPPCVIVLLSHTHTHTHTHRNIDFNQPHVLKFYALSPSCGGKIDTFTHTRLTPSHVVKEMELTAHGYGTRVCLVCPGSAGTGCEKTNTRTHTHTKLTT